MTRNQNLAAVGLLLAVAAAIMIWFQVRPAPAPAPAASTAPAAKPTQSGSASAPQPATKPRVRRLEDPSGRGELLRQIREVHAKRGTPAAPASSPGSATPAPALPPAPTIEKEYIRASVRELIPLLVECYEQALVRDPKLAGSVVVDFTIEGEPGVGGVVGESAIDPAASTLTDRELGECVQETMFAIEIEPPAGGGVVKVRYPFEFRTGSE